MINFELKSGRKLRRTQDPQAVFGKCLRNRAQNSALDISATFKGIEDFLSERIFQYGIDREVTTQRRFFHRHSRIAFNDESSVAASAFSFPARDRNVQVWAELVDCKKFAYSVHVPEPIQQVS